MEGDARYWKDKWTEAQKELAALRAAIKDEFEWLDDRQAHELIREEKRNGKQRTAKK